MDHNLGEHCLEVRRRVVCQVVSRSEERRHELYEDIMNPEHPSEFSLLVEYIEM